MIAHHGDAERREKKGQQNVDRNVAPQLDKPRILKLGMSIEGTALSYTPAEGSVTRARQKLALTIPTLREAANLPGLLNHVRSVLDPLEIDYEILVVDDDSR